MQPNKKLNGMPSILDDTPMPFSGPDKNTPADFDAAYNTWRTNKNPDTNTQLINSVRPIIDTAVHSYAGANANPTLKSKAKLMALKAMETFDPERGNVKTHLLSQLQGLRRLSAQAQNIISIPEQVGLDYQKMNEAENNLRDDLGRDPTDEELADYTGLSTRRLRKIRAFNQPVASGSTAQETSDDMFSEEISSRIPGRQNSAKAWENFVYEDLNPTDKIIMNSLLGRNGKKRMSTQEIAARLNITPGAVSQRAAKIQSMLDKRFDLGGF